MPATRVLRFGNGSVRVETDAPGDLGWLAECLTPQFCIAHDGRHDAVVTLSRDGRRHRELLARGPAPEGARVVCFALDSRTVSHPRWGDPDGTSTAFDEEYRVFYVIDGRRVDIVADRASPWLRVALLRVVREIIMARCARDGWLAVHGAAAIAGGRAVVIAGPKHAGKTSLLVHALTHPGVALAANDRVMVADGEDPISVRGMPTLVKVRAGTTRLFPRPFATWNGHPDRACLTIEEAARDVRPSGGPDAPLLLSPAQFAAAFGKPQVPAAPLHALVFPRLDGEGDALEVTDLAAPEAERRLQAALFRAGCEPPEDQAFAFGAAATGTAGLAARCRRLAERVRCVECRLGPAAYAGDPEAKRFVEAVFA